MINMLRIFVILSLLLTGVAGCATSYSKDQAENEEGANHFTSPPQLTLIVDGDSYAVAQGGYSWSYENTDGTTVNVAADSMSPSEMVNGRNSIEVDEDTEITLQFEMDPADYKVKIWDKDNTVKAVYDKIDLSEYRGNVIYEVYANWEQGSSSYAFLLYIR